MGGIFPPEKNEYDFKRARFFEDNWGLSIDPAFSGHSPKKKLAEGQEN